MIKRFVHAVLIAMIVAPMSMPAYSRGFGGGGFGGGGGRGFGGGGFGGSGGRGFGGGGFGGGDRSFAGFGGSHSVDSFGGMSDHFSGADAFHGSAADGGFGHIAGYQHRAPDTFNTANVQMQGKSVRNSFNNDQINVNHNTFNSFNHNSFNNYGHYGYNGYHPYSYGYGYGGGGGWWGYPGSWYVPGWSAATAWTFAGVASLGTFLGLASLGAEGGGGGNATSNVTYNNDTVYVNGQPSGSAQQYYQQSQQLAQTGVTPPTASDQEANTGPWQPLGVFALAEPGESQSNMMLQLAINGDGVVRGNYFNQLTNESSEVYGALDKQTQRISWTIGQNTSTVFDAGLADLVQNDSSVLVHYGPTNTQRMTLVRLPQPTAQPDSAPVTGQNP